MDILDELVQIKKPLLILAGPGMGKTYTLAYKIKNLVENQKTRPDEISIITFTNEAAINMRKKISSKGDKRIYVRQDLQPSVIYTMHKLGNRIIKENHSKLGLKKDFKVLSSGYLKDMLIRDCSQIIGAKRQNANETIMCRQRGKCIRTNSLKCKICSEYIKLLRKFNYIDHDEQVLLSCKLLRENKDILRDEQQKAKYLLVDEYQDINYAQWELIKLLSEGKADNLFVVGDDYQSIYGFRGGHPKYIRNFKNDYSPNAVVRHLTKCYRCPPKIFKGSFHMVQKYNGGDIELLDKLEFTEKSEAPIKVYNFKHHNLEADFIAREIKEIGPSYDVLILVPTFDYIAPIKRALRKRFIDVSCSYNIEKTDLYLINVLFKWLKNPSDNFNFRILIEKIINKGLSDIPAKQTEFVGKAENRKKREKALKQISDFWKEIGKRKTLYLKVKTLEKNKLFNKLLGIITELRKAYNKGNNNDLMLTIMSKLKVWQDISHFSDEVNSIIEEVKSLAMASADCGVRIMTMRKAKGLEADYVFIVGLENNVSPRMEATEGEKEEDSRLLYVSMTRAKKELYLLYSDVRDKSITKVQTDGKSEFIDAIPGQYKEDKIHGK